MHVESFQRLLQPLFEAVRGRALDTGLMDHLNIAFAPDSELFRAIRSGCCAAIEAGWMCSREAGGIRYGRVIEAAHGSASLSVDVVSMNDVVGPHHRHPNGEIDMIMPVDPGARFDGHGAGWLVYGAGSDHRPTVDGGRALVLYLLPDGAIEFTGGRR